MNALELQQSFTDARAIRVAVVPVGDISEEKFKEYSDLIKTFGVIELANITRSGEARSPFDNLNWMDSHIILNFIDRKAIRSDWEDFQVYRKLLGVIGIIHCHSSPDLAATYSKFEVQLQQFPTVSASVCFAFDPMVDQPDLERGNLVMIPNGDRKHLLFYLSTLLIDFSHTLMKHLEKMMTDQDQSAYLSTPLDPCKNWDEISRLKKRKAPRMNKCKGDVCLLAGSPIDAINHYTQSIEQLKSNSDWEWVAGCLEGYCASLVAIKQMGFTVNYETITGPDQNPAKGTDQEIIDRCTEAIGHYNRRRAVNLELELTLKLARFYASLDRKQEACDILMTANEIGADFSTQEKIILTCSIALMCKTMGFRRKFAFFLREAAVLYHKIYNLTTAHYMLNLAAKYYQLEDLDPDLVDQVEEELQRPVPVPTVNVRTGRRTRAGSRIVAKAPVAKTHTVRKAGWFYLQRVVLLHLESVAKMINDPLSTCKYVVHLLRTQYPNLNGSKQQELIMDLTNFSKQLHTTLNTNANMNVLGFPFVLRVHPLNLPAHLGAVAKPAAAGESTGPKGPFIYTPFLQKAGKRTGMVWVQGEMVEVKVVLSNPFAFEVPIQSISLKCTGVAFQAFPLTLRVPPFTTHFAVALCGIPLESGTLVIQAVSIKAFDLYSDHPVGQNGIALPLIENLSKHERYDLQRWKERKTEKANELPHHGRASQGDEIHLTHISITPPLPLLSVRYSFHGSALSLFVGERHTTVMEISNIGTQKIEYILIQMNEFQQDKKPTYKSDDETTEDDRPVFRWDANYLASRLPLRPGNSLNLPVHVYAKPGSTGATFVLHYGTHASSRSRQASLPFALNIQQGPLIANLEIRLSSSRLLPSMRHFLIHPTPLDPLPSRAQKKDPTTLSSPPSLSFTPQLVTPRPSPAQIPTAQRDRPSPAAINSKRSPMDSPSISTPPTALRSLAPSLSSLPSPLVVPGSPNPASGAPASPSAFSAFSSPKSNFVSTPSSLAPIPPNLFAEDSQKPDETALIPNPNQPLPENSAEPALDTAEKSEKEESDAKSAAELAPLLNSDAQSNTEPSEITIAEPPASENGPPKMELPPDFVVSAPDGSEPELKELNSEASEQNSGTLQPPHLRRELSATSSPFLSKPLLGPGKVMALYDGSLSPVPGHHPHPHTVLLSFDSSDAPPPSPRTPPPLTPLSPPPSSTPDPPPSLPGISSPPQLSEKESGAYPPPPSDTRPSPPISPTLVLDDKMTEEKGKGGGEGRGGEGEKEGGGFISPSSTFGDFGGDNDIALMIFDIENPSSQLFVISCEIDDTDEESPGLGHQLVSAPSSIQRAILPIKRVWWADESIPPLQTSNKQFIKPKKQLTPEEEKNIRLLQTYKRFLTQHVHITWSSIDHTHGRVDLLGLALNTQHLSKLKRDAITVGFSPHTGCNTTVGSFEEVVIAVTNRTSHVLRDLSLNIQILNESKPQQKFDVSGYLAWVGPLQVAISELSPGGRFLHTLVVCAFAPGSYNIVATGLLSQKDKKEIEKDKKDTSFIFPCSHAFRITAKET